MPRNEFLFTNANYLLPYTGAGTGIIRAMEENPKVTFENMESAHEFVVIFRRESNQVSNQETNQESNQESNQETNQESNQESNQEKPLKLSLTKAQKDIVNYCSVPRSAQEIMDRIGVSNQTANRKRHILPLVDMGVLEMTIPENPNDRNQKYRKVSQDAVVLQESEKTSQETSQEDDITSQETSQENDVKPLKTSQKKRPEKPSTSAKNDKPSETETL